MNRLIKEFYDSSNGISKELVNSRQIEIIDQLENPKQFLIDNFRNFDSSYNISLLLTFPQLWNNMKMVDWCEIVSKNFPRTKRDVDDLRLMNDDGEFSDLIFLHQYLNIDPIDVLVNHVQPSKKDLIVCLKFMRKYGGKLFIDSGELKEDLKDFYNTTLNELKNNSEKLIAQGFKRGYKTRDELDLQLNQVLQSL